MKMNFRQKAKSTLSILLILCMIFSVLTVGIVATSAAEVDQAEAGADVDVAETGAGMTVVANQYVYAKDYKPSGWDNTWFSGGGKYFGHFWNSSDATTKYEDVEFSVHSGTAGTAGAILKAKFTKSNTYDRVIFTRNGSSSTGMWNDEWNSSGTITISSSKNLFYGWTSKGTADGDHNASNTASTEYYAVKPKSVTATVIGANSGSGTSADPFIVSTGAKFTVQLTATKDDEGMTGFGWNINATNAKDSSGTANTYTKEYTAVFTANTTTEYTGYAWCYKDSTDNYSSGYATSNKIYVKTISSKDVLPAPTISLSRVAGGTTYNSPTTANDTDTIKVKITNYAALKDYCDFTVSTGTMGAIDSDGEFTLTGLSSSGSGTSNSIKVTATIKSASQSSYTFDAFTEVNSAESNSKSLKIYKPVYCLVGDVDAIKDITVTEGSGDSWKWYTWQSGAAIATATTTPGVYTFTFETQTDPNHKTINFGVLEGQTGASNQRGFNLGLVDQAGNGTSTGWYNSMGEDYQVPNDGVADTDKLYIVDGNGKGSLVLKKNAHYVITVDQTKTSQKIASTNATTHSLMTITTDLSDVTVSAKKKTFNATSDTYSDAADAAATIGTASVQPAVLNRNTTTTLTATVVNSNYEFTGWYSDAACTNQEYAASECTASGNVYTKTVTVSDPYVTYYALFSQKKPATHTITVSAPAGCTITKVSGTASGSGTTYTAYEGATVKFSYSITDNSRKFNSWNITSGGSPLTVTTSDANGSFTMPKADVTVSANVTDKPKATVSVTSSNVDMGTAAQTDPAEGSDIFIGETTITTTATVKPGYAFKNWSITGATLNSGSSATNTTINVTPNAANVKLVANFDYKEYQLYYNGGTIPMIRQSDGSYISAGTVKSSSTQGSGTFTIYNASDKTYAYSKAGGSYDWLFDTTHTTADIGNNASAVSGAWSTTKPTAGNLYRQYLGTDRYVKFIPASDSHKNGQITTLANYDNTSTMANVYTKEGTIRTSGDSLYEDSGDVTAKFAEYTKITNINGTDVTALPKGMYAANYGHQYSIPKGSTVTVETKLTANSIKENWYVSHFVVNGWKVPATKLSNGVYTAYIDIDDTYAMTKTAAISNAYEITPVLYNSDIEADKGYVTFYVDADYVPAIWETDTLAVQGFWDGATKSHYTGTYPGVPMARTGKYYEIKIPLFNYTYNATSKKMVKDSAHPVSSVTISAYTADDLNYKIKYNDGKSFWEAKKNYQTYDYGDFSVLAQIPNIQSIMFRPMYETGYNNNQDTDANWNLEGTQNKYHLLTDYYGRPIDLLGNVLDLGNKKVEDLKVSDAQVKVVSLGDWDNQGNEEKTGAPTQATLNGLNKALPKDRTEGHWATRWRAFVKNGNDFYRAAVGTQADFINTTPGEATPTINALFYKDSGRTAYKASDLANKITYVSYEGEYQKGYKYSGMAYDDTGRRIDGQWYYSALGKEFNSNVQIGITSDGTIDKDHVRIDTDSNSGENTGWIGTESKSVATLDNKTTATYTNVTTNGNLNMVLGAGYTFEGWYIKGGTEAAPTYTKIGDNYMDLQTTMLINNTYTIVGIVEKIPSGSLVVTHSKYTGSNPAAFGGTGKYYVSAVVYPTKADAEAGTNGREISEQQNQITVSGLQSTDYLKITLHTKCVGIDEFYAWYEEQLGDNYSRTGNYYEICDEKEDPVGKNEVSYTFFAADCSTFFKNNELDRKSLDFYSDITHISALANITYQYFDRFAVNGKGKMVQYTVRDVELTEDEINAGYIPSDDKISEYAPDVIDTIYTDTKWDLTDAYKIDKRKANITVTATQKDKDCFVQYFTPEVIESALLSGESEEIASDAAGWSNVTVPFNGLLLYDDAKSKSFSDLIEDDFFVTAPRQIGDWNFVRFDVYTYDRTTGVVGDEVIYTSNDSTYGYRIYADCAIYPVYTKAEVADDLSANIQTPVLNREVYGDSTSPIDKLYVDLVVSYINLSKTKGTDGALPEVVKYNVPETTGYTIETGVIVDRAKILKEADFNTLSTAAKGGDEDTTDTVLTGYKSTDYFKANTDSTFTDFMKTAINTETSTAKYTLGSANHTMTKYKFNNDDLTNKNRVDKVIKYTNSDAAQRYVFAAYSYVVVRTNDGTFVASAVSDAEYYNFCYIGNKPLSTVS